jgi:hypothetical protein
MYSSGGSKMHRIKVCRGKYFIGALFRNPNDYQATPVGAA